MGYVVRDGQLQKAHKVSLTLEQKKRVLKPTSKQKAIREKILRRKKAFLSKSLNGNLTKTISPSL